MSGEYKALLKHLDSYGPRYFTAEKERIFILKFLKTLSGVLKNLKEKELLNNDLNAQRKIALFANMDFLWKKHVTLLMTMDNDAVDFLFGFSLNRPQISRYETWMKEKEERSEAEENGDSLDDHLVDFKKRLAPLCIPGEEALPCVIAVENFEEQCHFREENRNLALKRALEAYYKASTAYAEDQCPLERWHLSVSLSAYKTAVYENNELLNELKRCLAQCREEDRRLSILASLQATEMHAARLVEIMQKIEMRHSIATQEIELKNKHKSYLSAATGSTVSNTAKDKVAAAPLKSSMTALSSCVMVSKSHATAVPPKSSAPIVSHPMTVPMPLVAPGGQPVRTPPPGLEHVIPLPAMVFSLLPTTELLYLPQGVIPHRVIFAPVLYQFKQAKLGLKTMPQHPSRRFEPS